MTELDWRAMRELLALGTRLREAAERALLPTSPVQVGASTAFEPPVNVWETVEDVIVEAELPGARSGNVDLRLEGNALLLAGELPDEGDMRSGSYVRLERPRGRFFRAVALPAEVSGETSATLAEGVLRVRLHKAGHARRQVAVAGEER